MAKFTEGQKVKWLRFDPASPATIRDVTIVDLHGATVTRYSIELSNSEIQTSVREADLAAA